MKKGLDSFYESPYCPLSFSSRSALSQEKYFLPVFLTVSCLERGHQCGHAHFNTFSDILPALE